MARTWVVDSSQAEEVTSTGVDISTKPAVGAHQNGGFVRSLRQDVFDQFDRLLKASSFARPVIEFIGGPKKSAPPLLQGADAFRKHCFEGELAPAPPDAFEGFLMG